MSTRDDVASVLRSTLERSATLASLSCRASDPAPPGWHRAGRLSEAERANITDQTVRDIVRPMLEALLSRRPRTGEARGAAASMG